MTIKTVFQKINTQPLPLKRAMVLTCINNDPSTLNQVSERYSKEYGHLSISTVSQTTTELSRLGYVVKSYASELLDNPNISKVVKEKLGNDRRSTYIYITGKGKKLLHDLEREFK